MEQTDFNTIVNKEKNLSINYTFDSFSISIKIVEKLKLLGYYCPTSIQRKSIPFALSGRNIMVASKTGSGKTLCFIIPIIEKLQKIKWSSNDLIGGCVIVPVRELAIQIFSICKNISSVYFLKVGLLIGGIKRSAPKTYNSIIITTIGRLFDEILIGKKFTLDFLKILAVDEVDQILDIGFKRSFLQILQFMPSFKQTLLFSATLTAKLKDIVRLNLTMPLFLYQKTVPKKIQGNLLEKSYLFPKNIYQYYCFIDSSQKTNFLYSFLVSHFKKKILVFFSTTKQVTFFFDVFSKFKLKSPLFKIYGGLKQVERTLNYVSFNQASSGVLLATDIISRGIDLKCVDWVIQFDCPQNTKSYLHRSGRTGRLSEIGRSLLILTKPETYFLLLLQKLSVSISNIKIRSKQWTQITGKIFNLTGKEQESGRKGTELYFSAQSAYVTYTRFIFSVQYNRNPDFNMIEWKKLGENYGLFR
jgi:ATP-dependent RNA helicase DDX10/DBP4